MTAGNLLRNRLHHHRRLRDPQSPTPQLLRQRNPNPPTLRQRRMQLMRILARPVALLPVLLFYSQPHSPSCGLVERHLKVIYSHLDSRSTPSTRRPARRAASR